MRPRTRFPGKVEDVQLQFFGRFTWKDITRIALPAALLYITTGNPVYTAIGLITGLALYIFRPYNRCLDQHIYHLIRFHLGRLL